MKRKPWIALLWGLAVGTLSCASSSPPPTAFLPYEEDAVDSYSRGPAPDWVMRTPEMSGRICAVGTVDPTFFRQDGVKHAGEAARNELARTIQVEVNTVMYDYQSTSGGQVSEAFVQQVVGTISDVVLSGAQVKETWYDKDGQVSRKGMTYALACLPTDSSVADLAERLKAQAPEEEQKIEQVRERAQSLFDELEANEERHAGTRSSTVAEKGK